MKLPIHRCYIRWYQYMPISFAATAMYMVSWFGAAIHDTSPKFSCKLGFYKLSSGQVNWPEKEEINNNTWHWTIVLIIITLLKVKHITGYKIKHDRKFLGTFIMSFIAFVTHIFKYHYMYYSVRLTENTISPLFISYFTSWNDNFLHGLHYTIH